jgi:UDPglucose 6-dehydrogenase
MTKYAANSMLATRISFMNDIANLCEIVGADVNMVRKGIGTDQRIGSKFLYAGCGYGGSCFPKDIKALIQTAKEKGYEMKVLKAVEEVNDTQKEILYRKLVKHLGENLKGKTIAIWGLSFKPNTDDVREAPALLLIEKLTNAGCNIRVFDPVAIPETKKTLKRNLTEFVDQIHFASDIYDAALESEALLLVTEWKEFRMPSWGVIRKAMKNPLILDGRNIYDKKELQELGFTYEGIGV